MSRFDDEMNPIWRDENGNRINPHTGEILPEKQLEYLQVDEDGEPLPEPKL